MTVPAATRGLKILGIILVALILSAVLRRAVRRVEERLARESGEIRAAQRTRTLAKVMTSAGIVTIWIVALLTVLGTIPIQLGPLLAGLGIGGLAIGFGAQSLVRDVVTGFFILLEDQYGIGDLVQINQGSTGGGPMGRVEQLTLRMTGLRDTDGSLHYIPNGSIINVANRSKDWSGFAMDVAVPIDADLEQVRSILAAQAESARDDETIGADLLGQPQVLGIEAIEEEVVRLRLMVETRPGRQATVARAMRARLRTAFEAAGIQASIT